jgi:hypothetical protein
VITKIVKHFRAFTLYKGNTAHVERKNKSHANNNRDNWKNLKIITRIPDQHTGKAQHQLTTKKNSHIG